VSLSGHADLPAVEIDLQPLFERTVQVAGQQVGRIAIVQLFYFCSCDTESEQ
jgi:hypothetical protein